MRTIRNLSLVLPPDFLFCFLFFPCFEIVYISSTIHRCAGEFFPVYSSSLFRLNYRSIAFYTSSMSTSLSYNYIILRFARYKDHYEFHKLTHSFEFTGYVHVIHVTLCHIASFSYVLSHCTGSVQRFLLFLHTTRTFHYSLSLYSYTGA